MGFFGYDDVTEDIYTLMAFTTSVLRARTRMIVMWMDTIFPLDLDPRCLLLFTKSKNDLFDVHMVLNMYTTFRW